MSSNHPDPGHGTPQAPAARDARGKGPGLAIGLIFGAGVAGAASSLILGPYLPDARLAAEYARLGGLAGVGTVFMAVLLVVVCVVSAIALSAAVRVKSLGESTAWAAAVGSTASGRKALGPLALNYAALALSLGLMTLDVLFGGFGGPWFLAVHAACLAVALWANIRCAQLLDELYLALWRDALALTAALFFAGFLALAALSQAGFAFGLSAYGLAVWFFATYLAAYLGVVWVRAPDMLNPNEGQGAS
jgi:hypothetical protein